MSKALGFVAKFAAPAKFAGPGRCASAAHVHTAVLALLLASGCQPAARPAPATEIPAPTMGSEAEVPKQTTAAPVDTKPTTGATSRAAEPCEPLVPREELLMPDHEPIVRGAPGWNYVEQLRADLDGDGAQETLWVLAQTEILKGEPVWDDGQPWQVYVEEEDGRVTHLFARYVQLARLEVSLARQETESADASSPKDEAPEILLDASGPSTAVIYRVRYEKPGQFSAHRVLEETNISRPEMVR